MIRRLLASLILCAAVAGAAHAADKKEDKDKKETSAPYVDLSPVAIPIVVDDRLVNYVFVTVRVDLAANVDSSKARDKEPYLRDALVRAAHRTPFTDPKNYTVVDAARLTATLQPSALAILGPRSVTKVEIVSQTPKQTSGLPKPKAAT